MGNFNQENQGKERVMRVIIYHDDADGRCAAAIAARFANLKMENMFFPVSYADPPPWPVLQKLSIGDEIWIVDFSFPDNEMAKILCVLGQSHTYWFDHHESKQDVYDQYKSVPGIRDTGHASCLSVWMWCNSPCATGPMPIPWPVRWIADRDVWRFEYGDDTKNFYEMYLQEGNKHPSSAMWDGYLMSERLREEYDKYLSQGEILRKARLGQLKSVALRIGYDVRLPGLPGARVLKMNYPGSGDLGEVVRSDFGYDIVWCYHERQINGAGMIRENSMYSATVDVGAICKGKGGGGHKGAAGFVEVL